MNETHEYWWRASEGDSWRGPFKEYADVRRDAGLNRLAPGFEIDVRPIERMTASKRDGEMEQ